MWHNITVTATEVSKLLLLTQQPRQSWKLQEGGFQRHDKQAGATALIDVTVVEAAVNQC